mmetsp:Transcript_96579/g.270349  ORF Transcript_96579/g.270349 Transcript_96579/m.270349 type:complete len:123 (-) Transcript_96579:290-658(-)
MADQSVSIRLIFANESDTREISFALGSPIRDLKKDILANHWPETIAVPAEEVERIRLFTAGQELGGKGNDDGKLLKDTKLSAPSSNAVPVHVCPVRRRADAQKPAADREAGEKHDRCFCVLQ